jgi:hypothetical protein
MLLFLVSAVRASNCNSLGGLPPRQGISIARIHAEFFCYLPNSG